MNSIIITILMICCMSGWESPSHMVPIGEQDVQQLMAEKMDVEGWKLSKKDNTYLFSSNPSDPDANGMMLAVNASTGTVYDATSGSPITNLVIKEAPNFKDITNGPVYQEEILKLANSVIKDSGLTADRKQWISGGYGDGYVYGDVIKDHTRIYIKLDVFTKDWKEIEKL